ncbi:MAG: hypothetical protein D6761_09190 [Candidatus Dadabacteria bacterium]|nr:MAG: hypothetical protein D6761_09190 [Candidatus Dadabacteria bacterium]
MQTVGRFILFVIAGFVSVVLLTVLVAMWIPRTWHVSATDVSSATPADVWRVVSDLRTWPEWSIWSTQHDPTISIDWIAAGGSEGFTWTGERAGQGELHVKSRAHDRMVYELRFTGSAMQVTGEILVRDARLDDARSIVTWRVYGDVGPNPFARLSVDLIRKVVDAETQQNLSGLLHVLDDSVVRAPAPERGVFTPPRAVSAPSPRTGN